MVNEIEVITLLGGIVVLVFLFRERKVLQGLRSHRLFMASYVCFLLGWTMTVLESFVLPNAANLAEHALYAGGGILLALWSYRFFREKDSHG